MEAGYKLLIKQSLHGYLYPAEVLAKHPGIQTSEIDYRDLVARPKAVVERIYDEFGYSMTPGLVRMLDDAQAKAGKHETKHLYSLSEFGLDEASIRQELAPLFDRFDWPSGDN